MRSTAVVVDPPFIDDPAGVRQAPEEVLVEALVPEAPVQALDEAVLLRLAGRDGVPLDATFLLPAQHRMRREFGSVVLDDGKRPAAQFDEAIEFADNPPPGERDVGNQRQALAGEVVHDHEHPEAPAVRQRV